MIKVSHLAKTRVKVRKRNYYMESMLCREGEGLGLFLQFTMMVYGKHVKLKD